MSFPSKVYCINLDRRPDRWQQVSEQFTKHNLQVERFAAIDWKLAGVPPIVAPTLSHYQVIQKAKAEGINDVLIFEDDAVLHEHFILWLNICKAHLPDNWDMLYLAGSHRNKPVPVNEHIYRVSHSFTSHAYILPDTMYDIVLEKLKDLQEPADCFYVELQKQYNCYVTNPPLAWQRGDFSDVEGRVMHYDHLKSNDQ
jgi:glycosyl transferase family 25